MSGTVDNRRLVRGLYSSFLRLARKFDKDPAGKVLLHRTSVNHVVGSAAEHYHKEILDSIFDKGKLFNPLNGFISCSDIVKKEFRKRHDVIINDRIDVGFSLLRSFSSVWSSYLECIKDAESFEEYDSQLNPENMYDFPVRLTSELNSGTLLISHPLIYGDLHRSVVLLLTCNKNGAYGLVINMPTQKTLASATRNLPQYIVDVFGDSVVMFGGSTRRLQFLHPFDHLGGTLVTNSDPPVFAGGSVVKAMDLVAQDPKHKKEFTFYAGCCFWSPKALQNEIQQGYWIPALAPSKSVLAVAQEMQRYFEFQRNQSELDDEDDSGAEEVEKFDACDDESGVESSEGDSTYSEPGERDSGPGFQGAPPPDLWNCMLRGLGGDFAHISTFPPWLDSSKVESLDWK